MARQLRQDHEGAWHHLMNRGAARRALFRDDGDRQSFLNCVGAASEKTGVDVHCFCLMDTHFHLLVASRSGRLADFMRLFAGAYSRNFNRRHNSNGPIFRARCHSVEINSDAHLLGASRYIHLNPAAAGIVVHPCDWPWSSAAAFTGRSQAHAWLQTEVILDMIGGQPLERRYEQYLLEGVDARTARFYIDLQWS